MLVEGQAGNVYTKQGGGSAFMFFSFSAIKKNRLHHLETLLIKHCWETITQYIKSTRVVLLLSAMMTHGT